MAFHAPDAASRAETSARRDPGQPLAIGRRRQGAAQSRFLTSASAIRRRAASSRVGFGSGRSAIQRFRTPGSARNEALSSALERCPLHKRSSSMKTAARYAVLVIAVVSASMPAYAKGCLKGAVVGGVAGHYAGHHAVLGAIAGCAVGHHQAKQRDRQQQGAQ
jgi:hypothetical protein